MRKKARPPGHARRVGGLGGAPSKTKSSLLVSSSSRFRLACISSLSVHVMAHLLKSSFGPLRHQTSKRLRKVSRLLRINRYIFRRLAYFVKRESVQEGRRARC